MRGLYRELVVAMRRFRAEHERDLTLAWTIAALERQKTLPDLKTLLMSAGGKQTRDQQRTALGIIGDRLGVKMQRFKFIRKPAA